MSPSKDFRLASGVAFALCLLPLASHALPVAAADDRVDQVSELVNVLRCEKAEAQELHRALRALAKLGPAAAPAVPSLLEVVKSHPGDAWSASQVRADAIFALGEIGASPELVVPALTKSLADRAVAGKRFTVGDLAAQALGKFGPRAKSAIPALVASVRVKDIWGSARTALGNIDPDQFPFYAQGEKAVRPLAHVLVAGKPAERRRAAEALRSLGEVARPALPELRRMLDDPDEWLRIRVAAALWDIDRDPRTVDVARQELASADPDLRSTAHSLLGRVQGMLARGASDKLKARIEAGLLTGLDDEVASVRLSAVRELRNIPALTGSLTDPDAEVRQVAARRLAQLRAKGAEVRGALIRLLADPDCGVKVAAADSLWQLHRYGPALRTFELALDDETRDVRRIAMRALRSMKKPPVSLASAVARRLADDYAGNRYMAVVVFKRWGSKATSAAPMIRELIDRHGDSPIGRSAKKALAHIESP